MHGEKSTFMPTRYLLDKVIVRYALDGMVSLSLGRTLSKEQLAALKLLHRSAPGQVELYLSPASANILGKLQRIGRFDVIVQGSMDRVQIATPTRYFTRWSRRLRQFGFSPEDARMLALASFSTNEDRNILGMHNFITYDHPLANLWGQRYNEIEARLNAMRSQLHSPYDYVQLPELELLK